MRSKVTGPSYCTYTSKTQELALFHSTCNFMEPASIINLYLLYLISFSQIPFQQVGEYYYFLFTEEKNWQAKRLSDWPLVTHIIGLKPRVQNFKLVKTTYHSDSLCVTYFEGIVKKFSNVSSGICISMHLFFSIIYPPRANFLFTFHARTITKWSF